MRTLQELVNREVIEKADLKNMRVAGSFGDLVILRREEHRYLCQSYGDDYVILYSYERKKRLRRR